MYLYEFLSVRVFVCVGAHFRSRGAFSLVQSTTITTTVTTIIKMWMVPFRCGRCLIVYVLRFNHLFIFITHVICYWYFQQRINKFLPLLVVRSFFLHSSLFLLRCKRFSVSIRLSFFSVLEQFFFSIIRTLLFSHWLSNVHARFCVGLVLLLLFFRLHSLQLIINSYWIVCTLKCYREINKIPINSYIACIDEWFKGVQSIKLERKNESPI